MVLTGFGGEGNLGAEGSHVVSLQGASDNAINDNMLCNSQWDNGVDWMVAAVPGYGQDSDCGWLVLGYSKVLVTHLTVGFEKLFRPRQWGNHVSTGTDWHAEVQIFYRDLDLESEYGP